MTPEVFDHKRFRDWLNQHDPNDIVGYQGESVCCPLATYLHDLGHTDALVGTIGTTMPDECWDHPYWAERFIYQVDALEDNDREPDEITAARALVCLNIAMSESMHRDSEAKFAQMAQQVDESAGP